MKPNFNSMSTKEKIRYICVFVPLLCTLALVLDILFGKPGSPFLTFVENTLLSVGWIGAVIFIVLTDLKGFVKFVLSVIAKGWSIGLAILPIFPICIFTAVCGLGIACMIAFALCTVFPAAITIYYYFFRKEN